MPPVTVIAYLQSLMHSVLLICTNTEGPSPGRAPFLHTCHYFLLLGRLWRETPHILKRPSDIYLDYFLTKTPTGGLMPPFLKYELKHRLTQCLSLVRSNFTVTI